MPTINNRQIWFIFLAIFGFFSLADFFQRFYTPFATPPENWLYELILFALFYWAPFVLITPVIFWMVQRFPLEKPHRLRHLPIYLVVSVIHTLIYSFLLMSYHDLHSGGSALANSTFAQKYLRALTRMATLSLFDFFAIVAFVHAIRYHIQLREREKETAELQLKTSELQTQLARAQLQSLKMQLHPHFLFNTLHSIAGLVREDRKKEAVQMISGLGDLLRHTLQNAGVQEVTLQDELDFVNKYLHIEQFRFQDRLTINTRIESDTLNAKVPYLILQPLVENAIRHGISRKASASLIEIQAFRQNERLHVQVRDDGPGLNGHASTGIGLNNVVDRLRRIYGAAHNFSLENAQEGGAVATIVIPFTEAESLYEQEVLAR